MPPTLTIVTIIGEIPLFVEGIAQAVRSSSDSVEVRAVHSSLADAAESGECDIAVLVTAPGNIGELIAAVGALSGAGTRVLVVSHDPDADVARQIASSGAFGQVSSRESLTSMVAAFNAVRAGSTYWSDTARGLIDAVETELPELSPREAGLLRLYLGSSGKSLEQTALALGISVETVRAHLVRVRARFKNAGYEVSDAISLRRVLVEHGLLG